MQINAKNNNCSSSSSRQQPPALTRVLVVTCHACQHLSDETMQIAEQYGAQVAVMPCCYKDHIGGRWKGLVNALGLSSIGVLMDLLSAGKMMRAGYEVKMKMIDSNITPQNRLILCRHQLRGCENRNASLANDQVGAEDNKVRGAHERLQKAYVRAHVKRANVVTRGCSSEANTDNDDDDSSSIMVSTDFIRASFGVVISFLIGVGLSVSLGSSKIVKYK